MTNPFQAAVEKAAAILLSYRGIHGDVPFPTIKDRLWPIIELEAGKNGVDRIFVKRFDEPMKPVIGQVRRMQEESAAYAGMQTHGMIYMCPTLELDWQRWVQIKEASHLLLDTNPDFVTNDADIDHVLTCFAQFDPADVTQQFIAELRATVCANELLFPFAARAELKAAYDQGDISPAAIAARVAIPAEIVRHVMGQSYWALAEKANTAIVAASVAGKLKVAKG